MVVKLMISTMNTNEHEMIMIYHVPTFMHNNHDSYKEILRYFKLESLELTRLQIDLTTCKITINYTDILEILNNYIIIANILYIYIYIYIYRR